MNQNNTYLLKEINSLDFNQLCFYIESLDPKRELFSYKLLKTKYENAYINKIKMRVQDIKAQKRNIYFKELFYCIYKKKSIKQCLLAIVSSSIIYGYGSFDGNTYCVESSLFPRNISRFFNGIQTNRKNYLSYELLDEFYYFMNKELTKNYFIKKYPLIGYFHTRKYNNFIKDNINSLNDSIELYINNNEINELKKIDINIPLLEFDISPSKKFKSFYRDSLDAFSAYQNAKFGNPRKYDKYYSVSGHEYFVE